MAKKAAKKATEKANKNWDVTVNDEHQVCLNLPEIQGAQLVGTPNQARELARELIKKANEAEKNKEKL